MVSSSLMEAEAGPSSPGESQGEQPQRRLPAESRSREPKELLGLDIGCSLIKAVVLRRRQGQITLKHAALAATPARVLTAGELTDGTTISHTLRSLCGDYGIRTRHVAVAVGGEKVFGQMELIPPGVGDGFGAFVEGKAREVISYPLESAALDYQTFDSVLGAQSQAVLWVSSASEQVEWLREAVTLAGRIPAVVDVQACALANALVYNYQPEPNEALVVLHVGLRHLSVLLVRGSALLYARDTVIARDWASADPDTLPQRVTQELDRHWETLKKHARPVGLQRIRLSGGPARSRELAEALHQQTGLPVDELDPFRKVVYSPASESGKIAREHGPTLAVAVGLALRSFQDL